MTENRGLDSFLEEDSVIRMLVQRRNGEISYPSRRMLRVCLRIWNMLDVKNRAYGNSALDPVRFFSRATTTEAIRVRLDDKLSRLARGSESGEDSTLDLVGYLVLLFVAEWGAKLDDPFGEMTVPSSDDR